MCSSSMLCVVVVSFVSLLSCCCSSLLMSVSVCVGLREAIRVERRDSRERGGRSSRTRERECNRGGRGLIGCTCYYSYCSCLLCCCFCLSCCCCCCCLSASELRERRVREGRMRVWSVQGERRRVRDRVVACRMIVITMCCSCRIAVASLCLFVSMLCLSLLCLSSTWLLLLIVA